METIVVPTDFSAAARNAALYAMELAHYFNARLVLLHAYPMPATTYEILPPDMYSALRDSAELSLRGLKEELLQKTRHQVEVRCISDMGGAYPVIEAQVKKQQAGIVVMGITGEAGPVKEHLLGSTSLKAARNLKVPVFIIPENVSYRKIQRLSFACDLEKTNETNFIYVLKYFSLLFGAGIELVHVSEPDTVLTEAETAMSDYIHKKLRTVPHESVFIQSSNTAAGLEAYFNGHPTDVIIVNPKTHSIFHSLFGITRKLAFHSSYPILAIH